MKLEITLSKGILKKKFEQKDKYNRLRDRIDKHKVVVSEELFDIWEEDIRKSENESLFMDWYFSLINSENRIVKVTLDKSKRTRGARSEEDKVLLRTSLESKDKIIVGNRNQDMIIKNKKVAFIDEKNFNREKYQTIDSNDILNFIMNKNRTLIFDIYETPIRLMIKFGSDAEILGKYLSKFIIGTKKLIIKDKFITQVENERNIKEYILKYLNPKKTKLTFIFPETRENSKSISRFKNYDGFKSEVLFLDSKLMHQSYLETDKYLIDLGYRLKVFGEEGKTEEEVINIIKKQKRD